jgi:AsmA protein
VRTRATLSGLKAISAARFRSLADAATIDSSIQLPIRTNSLEHWIINPLWRAQIMKKAYRNIGIGVAVFVVILLALPLFVSVNSFRPKIESELSSALGRKAELGDLSLSILRGHVSAANISIADDPAFSKKPFLTAKSVEIGVDLLPLIFSKKLNITGIALDEPSIALLSNANGKWNISSLAGNTSTPETPSSGTPSSLSIAKLEVTGGKLTVGKVGSTAKPLDIEDLNIEVDDFSSTSQFPFTLTAALPGGGKLKLQGKAGPIAPAGMPLQASLTVGKLDLSSIGADPDMGLGGIGNLDGDLDSDGTIATVNGSLSLDKLKLSPKGSPAGRSIQVKFATEYNLERRTGTISSGDVSVGKAVAHLTGNYQAAGEAAVLNMKLHAPALPVEEVESLLPALGVTLPAGSALKGGTLSAELDISGSTNSLAVAGPVKLENTQLDGFDLGSKLSALSALGIKAAPSKATAIQNASANTRVAPQGTRLDSINVQVPSIGKLTGAGSVSPTGALKFNMVAELSSAAVPQAAGRGIPFMIEGTAADPKFMPDVKGLAGSAVKELLSPETESTIKGLLRKNPR